MSVIPVIKWGELQRIFLSCVEIFSLCSGKSIGLVFRREHTGEGKTEN